MMIYINNLKRLFRKKSNLVFLVVVPAVSILLAIMMNTSGNNLPRVGFVDHDNTPYTNMLIRSLEGKSNVLLIKEDEVQTKLLSHTIQYAFVIDQGYTNNLVAGTDAVVKSYRLSESNHALSAKFAVDSYVSVSKNIAKAARGDTDKFYSGMALYENGNVKSVEKGFDDIRDRINKTSGVIGFLVMSMLFLASMSAITLLDDKKKRTFYRVAAAPVTTRQFMLQNVFSYFTVMVFQVLLILGVMRGVFGFYLGPDPIRLLILLLVFSAVCVSLGIAITNLSKDTRQASTLTSLIVTPICMLGGCWWPREVMPAWLLKVGDFIPTTWIIKSAVDVLHGSSLSSVSYEIIIMALFALVLFLLGSWKKVDVAG